MFGSKLKGVPRGRIRLMGLATVILFAGVTSTGVAAAAGGASDTVKAVAAGSKCGTLPSAPPADPSGLLKKLGATYQAEYNGYNLPVAASAWAHWKPKGKPPYKVGVLEAPLQNSYQTTQYDYIVNSLKSDHKLISKVIAEAVPDPTISTQLQDYQAMIGDGVNIILLSPLASQPFVGPIAQAAKAGIPTVEINQQVRSKYSVNVASNDYLLSGVATAGMLKLIGGKGFVLGVQGIPGVPTNTEALAGITAAVKECPGVTFDDSVIGNYDPAGAKTAVLQFLGTHPGTVAGVTEAAVMGSAIQSAFAQLGRPQPALADVVASEGSLAFWNQNKSKGYKDVATVFGATAMGYNVDTVAEWMLEGKGVKTSEIVLGPSVITAATLNKWVKPSWTTTSTVQPEPPAGTFGGPSYLAPLFNS